MPRSAGINLHTVGCSCAGTAWWCLTLHRARLSWSWRRATLCLYTRSARMAGSKARSRGTAGRASFPAASSTASDWDTCLLSSKITPSCCEVSSCRCLESSWQWWTERMRISSVYTRVDLSTNQPNFFQHIPDAMRLSQSLGAEHTFSVLHKDTLK